MEVSREITMTHQQHQLDSCCRTPRLPSFPFGRTTKLSETDRKLPSEPTQGGTGAVVPASLKLRPPTNYWPVGPSDRFYWRRGDPEDKPLGSGYTSVVYRGWDAVSGDAIAIKLVPKHKQRLLATETYYREVYRRLPLHPHPSILRLRGFLEDAENFYVVSDLCTGPDLVDYVLEFAPRTIPADAIRKLALQILSGVQHLHSRKLLHRDIKLDNILFTDSAKKQIAIVDFDMSVMLDRPDPPRPPKTPDEISVVGTKDYMAPEGYRGCYSEASDLWSVGVILYILIDGHFPYDLTNISGTRALRDVLRRGITIAPEVQRRYPMAVDLVQRLLTFDAKKRLGTAHQALNHPWFVLHGNTNPKTTVTTAAGSVVMTPRPLPVMVKTAATTTTRQHTPHKRAQEGETEPLASHAALHQKNALPLVPLRFPRALSPVPESKRVLATSRTLSRGAVAHPLKQHLEPLPTTEKSSTTSATTLSGSTVASPYDTYKASYTASQRTSNLTTTPTVPAAAVTTRPGTKDGTTKLKHHLSYGVRDGGSYSKLDIKDSSQALTARQENTSLYSVTQRSPAPRWMFHETLSPYTHRGSTAPGVGMLSSPPPPPPLPSLHGVLNSPSPSRNSKTPRTMKVTPLDMSKVTTSDARARRNTMNCLPALSGRKPGGTSTTYEQVHSARLPATKFWTLLSNNRRQSLSPTAQRRSLSKTLPGVSQCPKFGLSQYDCDSRAVTTRESRRREHHHVPKTLFMFDSECFVRQSKTLV